MTRYDPRVHGDIVSFLRERGFDSDTSATFRGPEPLKTVLSLEGAIAPYISGLRVSSQGGMATPTYVFVEVEGRLMLEDAGRGGAHSAADAADGPFDPYSRIPSENDPDSWYEFIDLDPSAFD